MLSVFILKCQCSEVILLTPNIVLHDERKCRLNDLEET